MLFLLIKLTMTKKMTTPSAGAGRRNAASCAVARDCKYADRFMITS